jgi:hypothetical protein
MSALLCSAAGADSSSPFTVIFGTLLGAFEKLQRATIIFAASLRPDTHNDTTATGRIFIKFNI